MPRFKYLTANYVEWLGLELLTVWDGFSCVCFVPENAAKPETSIRFRAGVVFEGHIYAQTDDNLAFDLAGSVVS